MVNGAFLGEGAASGVGTPSALMGAIASAAGSVTTADFVSSATGGMPPWPLPMLHLGATGIKGVIRGVLVVIEHDVADELHGDALAVKGNMRITRRIGAAGNHHNLL